MDCNACNACNGGLQYHSRQRNTMLTSYQQLFPGFTVIRVVEGVVVVQWCNPLTLKPEQSGGTGSRCDRSSPLERHDKGSRTRLALSYFCDPSAWR